MVIRDRETGSLWQHATGEALAGPLKGKQLPLLGGSLMTWSAWKKAYPHSLIALEPEEWTGLLPLDFTKKVLGRVSKKTPPGLSPTDQRLSNSEPIIGISVNSEFRAYPLRDLKHLTALEEQFSGKTIHLEYDPKSKAVLVLADGEPIHNQRTLWPGWYEFHPTTTIYGSTAKAGTPTSHGLE